VPVARSGPPTRGSVVLQPEVEPFGRAGVHRLRRRRRARGPIPRSAWQGPAARFPAGRRRAMEFALFGLTVSSSWGNGHATLWRGLIRALTGQGHEVVFFERDVPYYAVSRDLHRLCDGAELLLYPD